MLPTRKGSIRLFRLAGIDVYLHWTWFLMLIYQFQFRADRNLPLSWSLLEYLCLFGIVTVFVLAFYWMVERTSVKRALMRLLRSSLLDVYHEDYIEQARLRGISENRILIRHALKNAALPTLTLAGVQFGILFGGTLLVEIIYSYPGLGNLMVDAVRNADLPIIQAVGLTYCVVVLLINTGVDSLYLVLNPRLRVH